MRSTGTSLPGIVSTVNSSDHNHNHNSTAAQPSTAQRVTVATTDHTHTIYHTVTTYLRYGTVRYGTYHYSTSEERERHRSSTIEGSIRLIQHTTRTRYRGSKTRRHETDLTGVTGRQIRHLLHRRQQSLATRRFDPSNKRNANRLDRGDYSAHSERLSTIQLERDRETVGYSIQYPTATRER
jgi:hypothetical protein